MYDAYITHLNEIEIGRKLLKALKAPSTLMRFCLKMHTFRCVWAFRPHQYAERSLGPGFAVG